MMTRTATPDWDFFLSDLDPASSPPHVPLRRRLYAAACTARALWIFRTHGWARAHPYLQRLAAQPAGLNSRVNSSHGIGQRLRQHITAALQARRQQWTTRPHGGANSYATLHPDQAVRLARQEIFPCQLVTRALIPNALCLPRSLALATYLTALGLPAQVIVARGLTTAVPRNTFHSWTELYGTVINDNPDVQLGYTALQRVPSNKTVPPMR